MATQVGWWEAAPLAEPAGSRAPMPPAASPETWWEAAPLDSAPLDAPVQAAVVTPGIGRPLAATDEAGGLELADLAKAFGGGLVRASGSALRGLGEGFREGGEVVARGLNALTGTDTFRATNALTGPAQFLEQAGEDINNSISPAGQAAMAGSTPTGNLLTLEDISFGQQPTAAGYTLNALNVFGQLAPTVLAAIGTRGQSLKTQLGFSAGVAAATGGGAAAGEEGGRIRAMRPTELAQVPLYRELLAEGTTDADAREQTALAAESGAFRATAPVSALSGLLVGGVLSQPGQRALGRLLGQSRTARVAGGVAIEAPLEATQEVTEGVAQRGGASIATGEARELGEGSFAEFTLGAIGGSGPAVLGGLSRLDARPQADIPRTGKRAPLPANDTGLLPPELPAGVPFGEGGLVEEPPAPETDRRLVIGRDVVIASMRPAQAATQSVGQDALAAQASVAPIDDGFTPIDLAALASGVSPSAPATPIPANSTPIPANSPPPDYDLSGFAPPAPPIAPDEEYVDWQRPGVPLPQAPNVATQTPSMWDTSVRPAEPVQTPDLVASDPVPEAPRPPARTSLADPRLKRRDFKERLSLMASKLIKGGDVSLVGGKFSPLNDAVAADRETPVQRLPSINADWFKGLTGTENAMTTDQVKKAVDKALTGAKLGVREARVITMMLDESTGERTDPRMLEYVRGELEKARKLRGRASARQAKAGIPVEAYDDPDLEYAGERYAEDAYEPDWDGEQRALRELIEEGLRYDEAFTTQLVDEAARQDWRDAELAEALGAIISGGRANAKKDANGPAQGAGATGLGSNPAGSQGGPPAAGAATATTQSEPRSQARLTPARPAADPARANAKSQAETDPSEEGNFTLSAPAAPTKDRGAPTNPQAEYNDLLGVVPVQAQQLADSKAKKDGARNPPGEPVPVESQDGLFSGSDQQLELAANEAATSPTNDLPEPTEAQQKAGNYKLGKVRLHGLDISIENPKGSTRSGVDPDGKPWTVELPAHYGYVRRSTGADGEQVDVYLGDTASTDGPVFVVDQVDADTKSYDEAKAFVGFGNITKVRQAYYRAFRDGRGPARFGGFKKFENAEAFKAWLSNGDTARPVAAPAPTIQRKAVDTDTGKAFTVSQPADEALADVDAQIEFAERLLDCLLQ